MIFWALCNFDGIKINADKVKGCAWFRALAAMIHEPSNRVNMIITSCIVPNSK